MPDNPIHPHTTHLHPSSPSSDKPWRETPLIESPKLSLAAGCRILLKLENLQPSGSFKIRGLGNLVLKSSTSTSASSTSKPTHFFSSSGGNAGLAAVLAAQFVKRPCTVVVPLSTSALMIEKIRQAGAREVVQEGKSWKECDAYLREVVMVRESGEEEMGVYVPPFDHPDIWEGNGSLVEEIGRQMGGVEQKEAKGPPDWIICSVGGGGLFCGIIEGIQKAGWENSTKVLAVETSGADSLNQSLRAGKPITLEAITSMATSLGAVRVSNQTFDLAHHGIQNGTVKTTVLTDAEAALGSWKLLQDENETFLVEAACGVNIALCYGGRLEQALGRKPRPDETVVIVVCGGSNVSREMVERWKREYALDML